jgi:hypothetical protein
MIDFLKGRLRHGATVISFLGDNVFQSVIPGAGANADCHPLTNAQFELQGHSCLTGTGHFYHVDSAIYKDFNSDGYANMADVPARRAFLEGILSELKLVPQIHIAEGADRVVAFAREQQARKRPKKASMRKIWVTVKSGRVTPVDLHVQWSGADANAFYLVTNVLTGSFDTYRGGELTSKGFAVSLAANGSTAYFIEPSRFR